MTTAHIPATLRRLVRERSGACCEYCLLPEAYSFHTHPVDHIIAQKHGGETNEENLALSCITCNQAKGSDIASLDPAQRTLTALFNPRQDKWSAHFELKNGLIIPKTAVGRATAKLLQLNAPERVTEREALLQAGVSLSPS